MIDASFDSTKIPLQEILLRPEALRQRIAAATDQTIAREPELLRAGVVAEAYDKGPDEWDAEEPLEEVAS